MMKFKIKPLIGSCLLAASLMLPSVLPAQAAEKLMLGHAFPSEHIFHLTSSTFMDELKKQSADINVDYHPGGSLGAADIMTYLYMKHGRRSADDDELWFIRI